MPPAVHHGFGDPMQHITKELNLTEEQQAKIKPILEESIPLFKMIHEDAAAKAKAVINGVAAQVRPLLNTDQQEKLDKLRKRMEDARGAGMTGMMGGRPPGPMGHHPQAPGTENPQGSSVEKPSSEKPPGAAGERPQGRGGPVERLTRELNLTPDQQAKLKAITEGAAPQMKALRDDTSLAPEDRRAKMRAIIENVESQLRPALTPEQTQKLDEVKAKWREHRGQPGQSQQTPPPPQ